MASRSLDGTLTYGRIFCFFASRHEHQPLRTAAVVQEFVPWRGASVHEGICSDDRSRSFAAMIAERAPSVIDARQIVALIGLPLHIEAFKRGEIPSNWIIEPFRIDLIDGS